jgi:hypothetical protein
LGGEMLGTQAITAIGLIITNKNTINPPDHQHYSINIPRQSPINSHKQQTIPIMLY